MGVDHLILSADKMVGLFMHKATWVTFLRLQLLAGKILHDASAERVAQHVDSGLQTVPAGKGEMGRKQ